MIRKARKGDRIWFVYSSTIYQSPDVYVHQGEISETPPGFGSVDGVAWIKWHDGDSPRTSLMPMRGLFRKPWGAFSEAIDMLKKLEEEIEGRETALRMEWKRLENE